MEGERGRGAEGPREGGGEGWGEKREKQRERVHEKEREREEGGERKGGRVERDRERVLFIGTQFSNLYTAVDTPARASVIRFGRKSTVPAMQCGLKRRR